MSATTVELDRPALVEQMREDFRVLAAWHRRLGSWSAEDETELGEAIRASLAAGDDDHLLAWAEHLAAEAGVVRASCGPACRAAEARIRAEAAACREPERLAA